MTAPDDRRCEVLLSIQLALLGEVTPNLRAVAVSWDELHIHFDAFFDGAIGDREEDAMSTVETELIAYLDPKEQISYEVVRLDMPFPIPKHRTYVFFRREYD